MQSIFRSLVLITFIGFTGCINQKTQTNLTPISDFLRYDAQKPALISVHRGGGEEKNIPENGIESFTYYANKLPFCVIECDITTTKDSILVMMHDYTLDRTTTGNGKVAEKTYADLKPLFLKDNSGNITTFKIPTLEETLRWGKGKVYFTLDVKRGTPFKKVVELIEKTGTEQTAAVVTYNANQAFEVYQLNPALMISVGIMKMEDYERLKAGGLPDKNMIAFLGTREPNKELIDFLHSKGIMTILGTLGNLDKKAAANKEYLYQEWRKLGVDIFATDRPIQAFKSISELN